MISKISYISMVSFLVFIISFAAISPLKSCAVPSYDTFPGLKQPCDISGAERHVGNKPENDFGKFPGKWRRDGHPFDGKTKEYIKSPKSDFTPMLPWNIEIVDDPKYFYPGEIAVDTKDYPHMVYGGDHLYYAYYDDNGWHYETVDSSSGVGSNASLVIDSSGKVISVILICILLMSSLNMPQTNPVPG